MERKSVALVILLIYRSSEKCFNNNYVIMHNITTDLCVHTVRIQHVPKTVCAVVVHNTYNLHSEENEVGPASRQLAK